jgi:hypothetical protein
MENIPVYLFIIGLASFITIILCITGKKNKVKEKIETDFDYVILFKTSISIITIIYLIRLIIMFSTGMISNFYLPAIIGGTIALFPIIVLALIRYSTDKFKVL